MSLIFDQPFLEPYAAKLAPVRAAVEAQPLLLASPLLLLLPVLLSLRGKKRKVRGRRGSRGARWQHGCSRLCCAVLSLP